MADDRRRANREWHVISETNHCYDVEQYGFMSLAVLMDIRTELKTLNAVFRCHNFLAIPRKLDRISRNTAKPKRRKASIKRSE